MLRNRAAIAALLIAGSSILAPAVAHADPVISAPSGTTFQIGNDVNIVGSSCVAPGGAQTYGGVFARIGDDPTYYHGMERATVDGTFQWSGSSDDMPAGDLEFTFYCSTAPLTTLDLSNPDLLWVSAPYHRTFVAPAARTTSALKAAKSTKATKATKSTKAKRSKKAAKATKAAAKPNVATPVLAVDPGALPLVDRIGINGRHAADLKAQIDAHAAEGSTGASSSRMTNQHYVTAAFQVIAKKQPAASVMQPFVDQLDAGETRVQVFENIALTKHDAAWWNAQPLS